MLLDPERKLAAAIFSQAAADLEGRHSKKTYQERLAPEAAREWIEEAGEGFQFWCHVAGRDWRDVRRDLRRYETGCSLR